MQRFFRFLLVSCLPFLLQAPPLFAEGTPDDPSKPNYGVVLSPPAWSPEQLQHTLHRLPAPYSKPTQAHSITASRFMDPMRRHLLPVYRDAKSIEPELCSPTGPKLSDLIAKATSELKFLRYDKAEIQLARARLAINCGTEAASNQTIGQLLFLMGVVRISQDKDDDGFFDDAIHIAPDFPFPSLYDQLTQTHFRDALARRGRRPLTTVTLQNTESAGLRLRIDGMIQPPGTLQLASGRHFLQWVDSRGRGVAGGMVVLTSEVQGSWPPLELTFPDVGEVRRKFEAEVSSGQLSAAFNELLWNSFRPDTPSWITIIFDEGGSESPTVYSLSPSGQCEPVSLLELKTTFASAMPWYIAGGLGVIGLSSSSYYVYAYAQANKINLQQAPDHDRFDRLVQRGIIAEAVSVASYVGMATSAGIGWVRKANDGVANRSAKSPTRKLSAAMTPAGFMLEGTF